MAKPPYDFLFRYQLTSCDAVDRWVAVVFPLLHSNTTDMIPLSLIVTLENLERLTLAVRGLNSFRLNFCHDAITHCLEIGV